MRAPRCVQALSEISRCRKYHTVACVCVRVCVRTRVWSFSTRGRNYPMSAWMHTASRLHFIVLMLTSVEVATTVNPNYK